MYVDIATGQKHWREIYKLCIGFINPRPIALVATRGADGSQNLAPYSFYNMVSANPPVVIVCPTVNRHGKHKDTYHNIEQTREFVVATVSTELGAKMVACAGLYPYGQSEFTLCGLTPASATKVQAPLVKEAPVNIECRLREIKLLGDGGPGSGNVIFGDIVAIHADDRILDDNGVPDPHKLHTVGRLGGSWYADAAEPYEMRIPEV